MCGGTGGPIWWPLKSSRISEAHSAFTAIRATETCKKTPALPLWASAASLKRTHLLLDLHPFVPPLPGGVVVLRSLTINWVIDGWGLLS